jgi:hypothetical protein
MSVLKVKFGDFSYGGIDIDFYFDDVKVQSFWFSLCVDSFTSITEFLEQFLYNNSPQMIWSKEQLSEKQRVVRSLSTCLEGEGPDLDLKLEKIRTAIPCDGGTAYQYDTVRLTISGYQGDYLETDPIDHVMIGDKKQVIGELYFSLMNLLGYEVAKKGHKDEYYEQKPLQDYNDCKSLIIEKFLYPDLEKYYIDTGVHLKQQIIRKVKIFKKSKIAPKDIFIEKKNNPRDCEIFYQIDESESKIENINSMRMILPVKDIKKQILQLQVELQ